jgi:hypothetical protein
MGHSGLLRVVGRNSREAATRRLGPAGKTARAVRGNARTPPARGVVNARGARVWWCGGALDGGAVGAGR